MHARTQLLLFLLWLAAACERSPSFDARYRKQEAMIRASANSMEQDLSRQIDAAENAARAMDEAPPSLPADAGR